MLLDLFGLDGDPAAAHGAAALEDIASGSRAHTDTESVDFRPALFLRLVGSLWHK